MVKRCRDCLRVGLLYPAIYEAAVASLAYQNMYYLLNSLEYVYAERIVARSMAGPEPAPRSLETGRPLREFDVVVVPVSYELDYVTLGRLFHAAGLPLLRREMRRGEGPLVVVGGPVASMNPVVALEFADLVAVGEAEPLLPLLAEKAYEHGPWRALEELECRPGFLAPGCEGVEKVVVRDLDSAFHSTVQFRVPGSGEPWGEAYMVEASRGCPYMCRFCMEAHFLMPLRYRSLGRLLELIERGVEANGVRRVAFYALSFFDHPAADRLLEHVIGEGLEASIGSLRADTLNEDRVELLARAGQRVVTVAPETLSPRLCRGIGKCIGYDRVEEIAGWAWARRMHVKLYFMLGLPGETDRDVEEYAEALKKLSRRAPPVREAIRVTVNPMVPKPHTPMQFHRLIDRATYERRVRILRRAQSKVLTVEPLSYRYAYAQTVIARGDETVARLVDEWARLGGRLGQLWTAARRLGVNLDRYAYGPVEPRWHRLVRLGLPLKALERAYTYSTAEAENGNSVEHGGG
ncbi:B12-binding domain-containing radical SAM protein [Hyperthermus butylicus]|uniref:Fe-S oxidoreductase n=1 Tax=Hyperthermus butylicus (strain DSM 5456 / JCM 9403 / PLM1-5) TaxID=415426 RepID=A2BKT6_HYPBU|nr:radical SAM protein [Hyperthermus butylicus]ABM80597.1 Fe-S oxidoreductase [Hyperthermus butylicus DSM 5456]